MSHLKITFYENILVNYIAIEYWISPLCKTVDAVLLVMVGRLYARVLYSHVSHCFMVYT